MQRRKRQRSSSFTVFVALFAFLIMYSFSFAEEAKRSESDVARQLQNPLANFNLLGLPAQTSFQTYPERYGPNPSLLPVQRMLPSSPGPGWSAITQTVLPVYSSRNTAANFGVRDLSVSALVAPADAPTITWGLGPALSFPALNPVTKNERWGGGASGAVVYSLKAWVGGVFISNMWSFEGNQHNQAANQTLVQPFLSYNFSKGWYLTSAPAVSVNWQANSNNTWTVPVGGGVGKVVSVYGQMLNIAAQGYVYPVHPTPGSGWAVQTTLQWLFPK